MPQGTQERANQGSFAGTEVTFQSYDHPRFDQFRQFFPQRLGGCLVRQMAKGVNIRAMQDCHSTVDYRALAGQIKEIGRELGFASLGIARADVSAAAPGLAAWLEAGCHGEMDYMARHADLRTHPEQLHPGTVTVITSAVDNLPVHLAAAGPEIAMISRYALGRDYHKVIRNRLQKLANRIAGHIGPFGYRVFSDSAPVMEVELARQSGLGWRGKHTLLLSREGSWRFLGDLYTDLPLPPDQPAEEHCGSCTACFAACPTRAIVAPYRVDARLCISYLTIELHGAIPEKLRPLIGNRIYGCDDCQTCCPWNRFARLGDQEFAVRNGLDAAPLTALFAWTEQQFNDRLAGSPIRRIGHVRWLRNIAVGLGNGPTTPEIMTALGSRADHPSPLVREHVAWALARHGQSMA